MMNVVVVVPEVGVLMMRVHVDDIEQDTFNPASSYHHIVNELVVGRNTTNTTMVS